MKLKANIIVWMFAVAIWVWFVSTSVSSFTLEDDYPLISFTTVAATKRLYKEFITSVRNQLPTEPTDSRTHGVPLLRTISTLTAEDPRYILVTLENMEGNLVTLGIDVTNVYLVGFQAGNDSYFLNDQTEASQHLFTDVNQHVLDLGGRYGELETAADDYREDIRLGIGPLDGAIRNLYYYPPGSTTRQALARSLIICIQMIPEAIRFELILRELMWTIDRDYDGAVPNPAMISLENIWGEISTQFLQAGEGGTFNRPITLNRRIRPQPPEPATFDATRVADVIVSIALLLQACSLPPQSQLPSLIRSVVPKFEEDDDVCLDHEPTVRIKGRNDYCVDVKDAKYMDGDPVQLWPCKSNEDVNQLWTLKKDGTIRSNNKCLTTCSEFPGSYMMIYDCELANPNATLWEVDESGTITNPKYGVVLTVTSGSRGTNLTVDANINVPAQAWSPTNNTQPFVAVIVGLDSFCLTSGDFRTDRYCDKRNADVWIDYCSSENSKQKWILYADGTIRPYDDVALCLTGNDGVKESLVRILSCRPDFPGQRWTFKHDGSIWNLYYKRVLDVYYSNPTAHRIILYPFTGTPNQQWMPLI